MAHCLKLLETTTSSSIEYEVDNCGGVPNTNTFSEAERPSGVGECYSYSSESNADYLILRLSECFDQEELNILIYELNLSKMSSELLAFRLQDKNFVCSGTTVTFYCDREKDFKEFLHKGVFFWHNVKLLLLALGIEWYGPSH